MRAKLCLIVCLFTSIQYVSPNPIPFDMGLSPYLAMPPFQAQTPYLIAPRMDPYLSMAMPSQFFMPSPANFGQMLIDSSRRVQSGSVSRNGQATTNPRDQEKKALGDIPSSLLEPDGPTTFTERLSDSFSALGEGFRNHFRSLSENFSETVDDIKDAWRSDRSDSRKLG